MTDRYSGFIVTLEKDIRADDAEAIITAMRCLRGVIAVDPVVDQPGQWMAAARMRRETINALYEMLENFKRKVGDVP